MARALHEFRNPARFVVGTIGEPGDRSFFLQATAESRTVSVRCEKQQAEILAERMSALLDEVAAKLDAEIPPSARRVEDLDPLVLPVDSEFRVGMMGLGWDASASQIVVELISVEAETDDESVVLSDDEDGPDALRVYLTPDMARQFILRSEKVVSAGRTACPLCAEPMTADGHLCIRLNGYLPRREADLRALLSQ